MISTGDFKTGMIIKYENDLFQIVEYQFVKPGKGGAFVKTKLRNFKTGNIYERNFRSGEKFQDVFIEPRKLQYLYESAGMYHFLDQGNYEELTLDKQHLGDAVGYLKDHLEIEALFYEGKVMGVNLPIFINLKIKETEPGVKGDTAKLATKSATLETGLVIQVPLFVETGDTVKVDTRTGRYIERAY